MWGEREEKRRSRDKRIGGETRGVKKREEKGGEEEKIGKEKRH